MKYIILIMYLFLIGCDSKGVSPSDKRFGLYKVMIIDGCEYIYSGHMFGHKGNCTNEAH